MTDDMPQSTEMDTLPEDELLRLTYAQPVLGMALVSLVGRLRSLNAALANWLGGDPETLAGRTLEEIFFPGTGAKHSRLRCRGAAHSSTDGCRSAGQRPRFAIERGPAVGCAWSATGRANFGARESGNPAPNYRPGV